MELVAADNARFILAKGLLQSVENLRDKAVTIENTVGMEFIFTLIANGVTEEEICGKLGLDKTELKYISSCSPVLRKRYIQAKDFYLASLSMDTLVDNGLATATSFNKFEKNAVDYHVANIDRMSKLDVGEKENSGVVVNNTIVVRGKDEIPSLPPDLGEILDADPVDGTVVGQGKRDCHHR